MVSNANDRHPPARVDRIDHHSPQEEAGSDWKVRRWLVSFRSGIEWYSVGEFMAVDAATAIERAIAVFGPGEEQKAEEIPWDAAPLPRMKIPSPG